MNRAACDRSIFELGVKIAGKRIAANRLDGIQCARGDIAITLLLVADALFAGINQTEVRVHRLEIARRAGDMVRQRADGGAGREIHRRQTEHAPGKRKPRNQSAGRALHIAFHAGHLPREIDAGAGNHAVLRIEEARRMEERVAVHHAVTQELRVFKPGNHRKDALLLAPLEPGLEADEVVHRARLVFRAQLHGGVRLAPRPRIDQPDGLHRSERP